MVFSNFILSFLSLLSSSLFRVWWRSRPSARYGSGQSSVERPICVVNKLVFRLLAAVVCCTLYGCIGATMSSESFLYVLDFGRFELFVCQVLLRRSCQAVFGLRPVL